ncbi:CBS domain-containing protein [Altibacter lentus]|uniref:CBS domain-containing protein n=1 Tax=Altibacter lentus TaxID=1223410 RepID=UPI00054E70A7|nr:CBS domain-containing protein [Altibacter lentus]
MDTRSYIINDIQPFSIDSDIKEVQLAFNQLTYTHVPVERDGTYLGCLSETDAHCFDGTKSIHEYAYAVEGFYVRNNTNWLDILEAFALHNSNIMPVMGKNNEYLGYYELGDILNLFNDTPFLNEAGGIIVVEKGIRDYSFSEICQIVESNDTKILGAFVSKIENEVVQVTIKIGHTGMNSIVQTFRRYNYEVVSSHDEDTFLEDLKERSDYLNKYLNM